MKQLLKAKNEVVVPNHFRYNKEVQYRWGR